MKKINNVYYSSVFLLPFSLFVGLGITKIVNTSGSDSIISIILGTIIGIGINYLFTKLPEKQKKTCSFITNLFLLIIGLMTITKLISSVYLNKTNSLFIMLPLIILLFYTATKNNYAIFKTTTILNILFIGLIIFAFSSLIPSVNTDYFKPILINPVNNIFLGAFEYAIYSTTPLLVLPKLKEKYNYKIYLLSSLFLLIIFILIIGNLGIELSRSYRYPEYLIFKNIAILDFIENTQNILFFIWFINIYTLTSHSTINIKNIIGIKPLLILLIILLLFINIFLINNYLSLEFILQNIDILLTITIFIHILGKIIGKEN